MWGRAERNCWDIREQVINCLKFSRKGRLSWILFKQLKQSSLLFQNMQKMIEVSSTSRMQMVLLSSLWMTGHCWTFSTEVIKAVMKEGMMGQFVPLGLDVKVYHDKRQIQRLHWNTMYQYPHFEGMLANGSIEGLDLPYVQKTFPDEFIKHVVDCANTNLTKFFSVPPGAPKTFTGHHLMDTNLPVVEYMQHQDFTCLFLSFACAVHYLGLTDLANVFYINCKQSSFNSKDVYQNWTLFLQQWNNHNYSWLQPVRIDKRFDIFMDISTFPTVLQLQADDGGIQHAVTIVGKLVFDFNCPHALLLN